MLTYSSAVTVVGKLNGLPPFCFLFSFPYPLTLAHCLFCNRLLCSGEPLLYIWNPQDCPTLCTSRVANNSWYWNSVLVFCIISQIYSHHLILSVFIVSFQIPYLENFLSFFQHILGIWIRKVLITALLWALQHCLHFWLSSHSSSDRSSTADLQCQSNLTGSTMPSLKVQIHLQSMTQSLKLISDFVQP